jgi:hypothetical protein
MCTINKSLLAYKNYICTNRIFGTSFIPSSSEGECCFFIGIYNWFYYCWTPLYYRQWSQRPADVAKRRRGWEWGQSIRAKLCGVNSPLHPGAFDFDSSAPVSFHFHFYFYCQKWIISPRACLLQNTFFYILFRKKGEFAWSLATFPKKMQLYVLCLDISGKITSKKAQDQYKTHPNT